MERSVSGGKPAKLVAKAKGKLKAEVLLTSSRAVEAIRTMPKPEWTLADLKPDIDRLYPERQER